MLKLLKLVTSDRILRDPIPWSKVSGVEVVSRLLVWRSCWRRYLKWNTHYLLKHKLGTFNVSFKATCLCSSYLSLWRLLPWFFLSCHCSAERPDQPSGWSVRTWSRHCLTVLYPCLPSWILLPFSLGLFCSLTLFIYFTSCSQKSSRYLEMVFQPCCSQWYQKGWKETLGINYENFLLEILK